jgi:hypothetical protein
VNLALQHIKFTAPLALANFGTTSFDPQWILIRVTVIRFTRGKVMNVVYVVFTFLFSVLCLTETAMEIQKGIVFYSLFGSLILFLYKPVAALTHQPVAV